MDEQAILRKNEIDANRGLLKGYLFTAGVMVVLFIGYVTGLFVAGSGTLLNVYVSFPIIVTFLVAGFFTGRTKLVAMKWFKYVLLFQYVFVILVLNILLPKHAILGWALCIILGVHYFNPKVTVINYITVIILMFFGLYLGMLAGEWDSNLLDAATTINLNGVEIEVREATFAQRVEWLRYLRDNGDNRYLRAFLFYYLPRALIITIIAFVGGGISHRTFKLLNDEVDIATKNQKIQGELEMAKNIQASVLPRSSLDTSTGHVYGLMNPAKEVGGDFYDYFYVDENHIAFVIGDVSGKGVPAALFMMKAETLIKALSTSLASDPGHILERANKSLCENNEAGMFVTCWLGIMDITTGKLDFANAGHNRPVIIVDGKAGFLEGPHGLVLGGMDGMKYRNSSVQLKRGEKFILYTDGVTEAHAPNGDLYGDSRLLSFTQQHKDIAIKDFVSDLRNELADFSSGVDQFDDITMLMVEFLKGATITESRTFKAEVSELKNIFDFTDAMLTNIGFDKRTISKINTAMEEVFVNIASYAYDGGDGTVTLEISSDSEEVKITFVDHGKEFDPLAHEDPDLSLPLAERPIGGLGILMVKNIMDKVHYLHQNGQNILSLIKKRK